MSSFDDQAATPLTHDPPRYRVPIGLPMRSEGRARGAVVSIIIHALIIGLLIIPFMLPSSVIERMQQGAGGAGPAGGGGGGQNGTGGERTVETLHFVKLAPNPVPTPTTLPPVPTPVVPKVEPKVTPTPTPVPVPKPQSAVPAPAAQVASAVAGAGGGSGRDGSAGNGPGSGGGVGSGAGTGRGSANGPGTGGGTQANYPPQPVEFFLPPLPPPKSVQGFHFTAEFDVDSTGRVLDVKFTDTPDGAYNRRIQSVLRAMRFRPGTRPDGTPLRMKAQVGYDF